MEPKYSVYPNNLPGHYTVHIDISAASDKEAVAISQEIFNLAKTVKSTIASIVFLTDADDWAEHVHHDDHPNAVRTGCGRRIVIDENGHLVP